MINKSGFAWNDVKKCIQVDNNEVWEMYMQVNEFGAVCNTCFDYY